MAKLDTKELKEAEKTAKKLIKSISDTLNVAESLSRCDAIKFFPERNEKSEGFETALRKIQKETIDIINELQLEL